MGWSVSWAHPRFGGLIASSSFDSKVIVWSEKQSNQWQITYADSGHVASVNEVKFGPWESGLLLGCASSDGTVSVHTYAPQGAVASRCYPSSCGWCPDNQLGSCRHFFTA